jgi:hypothetical protein
MILMNVVTKVLQDADALKDGFQPCTAYIVICLVVPLAAGVAVGFGTGYLRKILKLGD